MDTPEQPVGMRLDERAVRVLAHPLRSRLLGELRLHGPATATQLAAALGTNTGATSYHLRALEDVGLVADTEEGVGKRRIWRASTDYHSWTNSGFADDEDAQTALGWLRRDYVRQFAARAERWLDAEVSWPAAWVDRLGLEDTVITVSPDQLTDFHAEFDALAEKYRRMGAGDPTARGVHIAVQMTPIELDPPEQP